MPRFTLPARWVAAALAVAALVPAAKADPLPTLTWNISYADPAGAGFNHATHGADRRATVADATAYLGTILDGRTAVAFNMSASATLPGNQLAEAGSGYSFFYATGAFVNGQTFERATAGTASAEDGYGTFDFTIDTDPDSSKKWNNSLAANSSGLSDLRSVALHELTHSLGFFSLIRSDGAGGGLASGPDPQVPNAVGSPDVYSQLDRNLYVGSGADAIAVIRPDMSFNVDQLTTTGESGKTDFTAARAGNNVYFHGEFAKAANGGNAVQMQGTSLGHVSSALNATAVMSPSITEGTEKRTFQNFEIGMLIDMGYNQYFWGSNASGNWGGNTSTSAGSPWRNINGENALSPVGQVATDIVLTFQGSGSASYTATNNLNLADTANRFNVNRINLDSSSAGTVTIADAGSQVLKFGTGIGVAPEIRQNNSGLVEIAHAIEIGSAGLKLGGDGTGAVTITGNISGTGAVTKSGAGTFALGGTNSYSDGTTVSAGTLVVAAAPALPSSGNVTLAGTGTLSTVGIAGSSTIQTAGNLVLAVGSTATISLDTTGVHALKFGSLTDSGMTSLTITGWQGPAYTAGTAGQIVFTSVSNATTANADYSAFLNKVSFTGASYNGATFVNHVGGGVQLVPTPEPATVLAVGAGALGLVGAIRRRYRKVAPAVAV